MEFEPESVAFGLRGGVATAAFGVALFLVRREPRSRGRLAVSVAFIGAWLCYAAVGVYMVITDVSGVGMLGDSGRRDRRRRRARVGGVRRIAPCEAG